MEPVGSAEMLQATYKSTRLHKPENQNLNTIPLSMGPNVFVFERRKSTWLVLNLDRCIREPREVKLFLSYVLK